MNLKTKKITINIKIEDCNYKPMTELAKKIYDAGDYDSVISDYLVETLNNLIEIKFCDQERDVAIINNKIDFFYSLSVGIETASIEALNESFDEDSEMTLPELVWALRKAFHTIDLNQNLN